MGGEGEYVPQPEIRYDGLQQLQREIGEVRMGRDEGVFGRDGFQEFLKEYRAKMDKGEWKWELFDEEDAEAIAFELEACEW